jgi:GNAT superfamily N-acetyltransferase
MRVRDIGPEDERCYFLCLEDWSEELTEAGDHKERWYGRMKDKGLRVKLAESDEGTVGGMIQYLPIEHSPAEGRDLYYVLCVWVHGYKQGRGNFQKRGMGKALLAAAEADAKSLGAKGLVAWGLRVPAFMRASWFKRQGYVEVDRGGIMSLLWKPFDPEAQAPRWIHRSKMPELLPGKVAVDSFMNGWCPGQNLVRERAKRAAASFGEAVAFREHDSSEPASFREWGISDALFVDGKEVPSGPPPSYEKIRKAIGKKVARLR